VSSKHPGKPIDNDLEQDLDNDFDSESEDLKMEIGSHKVPLLKLSIQSKRRRSTATSASFMDVNPSSMLLDDEEVGTPSNSKDSESSHESFEQLINCDEFSTPEKTRKSSTEESDSGISQDSNSTAPKTLQLLDIFSNADVNNHCISPRKS
jgi:hypothetical protein